MESPPFKTGQDGDRISTLPDELLIGILELLSVRDALHRPRHPCAKASKHSAEKTNVVWEPSKDLKHLKLKSLVMIGFEEEDKVANYTRLVMERATGLKIIVLQGHSCKACDAIECESTRSQVDKASRQRVRDLLTHGASSSVKIVFVDGYAQ